MKISFKILLLGLSAASAVDAAKKDARSHHKCPAPSTGQLPKHPPRAPCPKHLPNHARPTGKRKSSRRPRTTHHPSPVRHIEPHTMMNEPLLDTPYPHFDYEPDDATAAPLSASSSTSSVALSSLTSDWYIGLPLQGTPSSSSSSASSTTSMKSDTGLPLQGTVSSSTGTSFSSSSASDWDMGPPLVFTPLTLSQTATISASSSSQRSSRSSLGGADTVLPLQGSLSSTASTLLTSTPSSADLIIALPLPSTTTIEPASLPITAQSSLYSMSPSDAFSSSPTFKLQLLLFGAPGISSTSDVISGSPSGPSSFVESVILSLDGASRSSSSSALTSPSPSATVYNVNCDPSQSNNQCIRVGDTPMRVYCNTYYDGLSSRFIGPMQQCIELCASENCQALTYYKPAGTCYIWSDAGLPDSDSPYEDWIAIGADETCRGAETVDPSSRLRKRFHANAAKVTTIPNSSRPGSASHIKSDGPSVEVLDSANLKSAASANALTSRQTIESRAIAAQPVPACFAQTTSRAPRMCLSLLPLECQSLADPSISGTVSISSNTDKCRVALTALAVNPPAECFMPNLNAGVSIYMCLVRTISCTTCVTRFPRECTSFFPNTAIINNATLTACQTTLGAFGLGPASSCFEVGDTVSTLTGVNVGLCIQRLIPSCPSGRCGTPPTVAFETLSVSMVESSTQSFTSSSELGSLVIESTLVASSALESSTLALSTLLPTLLPSILGSSTVSSALPSISSTSSLTSSKTTSAASSATRIPCVTALPDVCQIPDSDQLSPLFLSIDVTDCQTTLDAFGTPNPAEDCFSPDALISFTGQDFAICLANNVPLCPPCLPELPPTCFEANEKLGVQCLVALGSFGQQAANACFTNGMLNRAVSEDLTKCLTRVLVCA